MADSRELYQQVILEHNKSLVILAKSMAVPIKRKVTTRCVAINSNLP